jgi:hypothetical protein
MRKAYRKEREEERKRTRVREIVWLSMRNEDSKERD